jgi:uncharacterized membrane protein
MKVKLLHAAISVLEILNGFLVIGITGSIIITVSSFVCNINEGSEDALVPLLEIRSLNNGSYLFALALKMIRFMIKSLEYALPPN